MVCAKRPYPLSLKDFMHHFQVEHYHNFTCLWRQLFYIENITPKSLRLDFLSIWHEGIQATYKFA